MKRFINDLSTNAKLISSFGILLILLGIVAITAYLSLTNLAKSERNIGENYYTTAIDLATLRAHEDYMRAEILDMMLTPKLADQQAIELTITDRVTQVNAIMIDLKGLDSDPTFQSELQQLKADVEAYRQIRAQEIALIYAGKTLDAQQIGLTTGAVAFETIRNSIVKMGTEATTRANGQLAEDQQAARNSTILFLVIGCIALVLTVVLVVILNRTIARPLTDITKAAEQIGSGNLLIDLPKAQRRDEVGVLMQTFSHTIQSLREIAGVAENIAAGDLRGEFKPQSEKDVLGNSLARMVENLRRMTIDISGAVGQLGSSASEILAATTQVASGTTESAAAINETTTTVEEVRQAAQLSSQKAQSVSDSAQRVAQVSEDGQKAVKDTSAGMNHIREQMETIAQTVVRLSEQSQSIGGIIASVADLADQSNLLAVNAAIEAAKAGEQGKGFAVVAQEIKSLAEQSKQATAQVRGILSDVQKATGNAVMATEQGSKAVEAGVKQAAEAGEAIQALAETSNEAVQTAIQIVSSSRQQVVGMDQIGVAMENINQAGSQTAASMKQMEAAAQNLHELGEKLKELVAQFKVQ
jgi:methyl-accepting chemotaxis protein